MADKAAMDRMRMATIRTRVPTIVRNTMHNVHRLGEVPAAMLGGKPLKGCTSILVGAGASLERDIGLLRDLSGKACVWTVNTVAPRLYDEGIRPDYLVNIESLPMGHQVDKSKVGAVVADVSSHPDTFKHADFWTLNASPHNQPLLYALDVPPIWGGAAAALTAFQLALEWGSERLALVGFDLAYNRDRGKAYPDGTGWGGLTYRMDGDQLVFEGREDRDELHRENGVPMVPRRRPAIKVPAWRGRGHVHTTLELEQQRQWLEVAAKAWPDRELFNTSVGGARINGWREQPLKKVPMGAEPGEPKRVCVDPGPAIERIREEARVTKELSGRWIVEPKPPWELFAPQARGRLFIDGLAAGDLAGLQEHRMTPPAKMRAIYEVFGAAADAALAAMEGAA